MTTLKLFIFTYIVIFLSMFSPSLKAMSEPLRKKRIPKRKRCRVVQSLKKNAKERFTRSKNRSLMYSRVRRQQLQAQREQEQKKLRMQQEQEEKEREEEELRRIEKLSARHKPGEIEFQECCLTWWFSCCCLSECSVCYDCSHQVSREDRAKINDLRERKEQELLTEKERRARVAHEEWLEKQRQEREKQKHLDELRRQKKEHDDFITRNMSPEERLEYIISQLPEEPYSRGRKRYSRNYFS